MIKKGASIIHRSEYMDWRKQGNAFLFTDDEKCYTQPNYTLASVSAGKMVIHVLKCIDFEREDKLCIKEDFGLIF